MLGGFFTKIKLYLFIAGSVIIALVLSWFGGKREAALEKEKEDLQNYIDTRKRMDEAPTNFDTPDSARDWLRKRGE